MTGDRLPWETGRGWTLLARHVLPVAGPPIENGWVRIERGRIAAVGRGRPPGTVVDPGGVIVVPGLVNPHTHLEFSDLESPLSAAGGLPGWIERVVAVRRGRAAAAGEERPGRAAAIAAGLDESARAGVTTIGDIATAVPPAVSSGPRVRVFREALGLAPAAMRAAHRTLARDLDALARGGGRPGASPHAPYSVGRSLGLAVMAEAVRRKLPVAMHLAESGEEAELLANRSGPLRKLLDRLGAWGDSPPRLVPVADWISLLARAGRGMVVHGTFLPEDAEALARLARHRSRLCVVVCPRTTRMLAGRLPPVAAFRGCGVRVAVGTDSRASSPDLSVLSEAATLVAAGVAGPDEALEMVTVDAAWALGLEGSCGRIVPGRPADLAVLRPVDGHADPHAAALDPATRVVATLRRGRLIAAAERSGFGL